MNRSSRYRAVLADALRESANNRIARLAAALAYYAMFSLVPLLILLLAGARLGLGDAGDDRVVQHIGAVVGEPAAGEIAELLLGLRPRTDIATTLIGVAGLLFGASALFQHIKDSLNTIWEVVPHPRRGALRGFVIDRLLAVLMVTFVGIVALVGLALSLEVTAWAGAFARVLPGVPPWYVVRAAQLTLSFGIVTLVVALTFRMLPDCHVAWRDIWVGAGVTSALVVASQVLIGLYFRSSTIGSAYGAIGAAVVVLVWVYYSAAVFFFGAELTWAYANRAGARITPAPHAVSLAAGDRAAQGMLRAEEIERAAGQGEREVGGGDSR